MSKQKNIHFDFKLSRGEVGAVVAMFTVVVVLAVFELVAHTSIRYLIPGYPSPEQQLEIARSSMKLDSLQRSIFRWELYSGNLRLILDGGKPRSIDDLYRQAEEEYTLKDAKAIEAADSTLRAQIAELEKNEIPEPETESIPIEEVHLSKPISGKVVKEFDANSHPGVNVSAKEGSVIKAAMDGSVVFTSWSEEELWTIVLQHGNGLISIYSHAAKLEKQKGDPVMSGKPIATLGVAGKDPKSQACLHFELWQDGEPLNPTDYLKFK